jgi:hypothetical protein
MQLYGMSTGNILRAPDQEDAFRQAHRGSDEHDEIEPGRGLQEKMSPAFAVVRHS